MRTRCRATVHREQGVELGFAGAVPLCESEHGGGLVGGVVVVVRVGVGVDAGDQQLHDAFERATLLGGVVGPHPQEAGVALPASALAVRDAGGGVLPEPEPVEVLEAVRLQLGLPSMSWKTSRGLGAVRSARVDAPIPGMRTAPFTGCRDASSAMVVMPASWSRARGVLRSPATATSSSRCRYRASHPARNAHAVRHGAGAGSATTSDPGVTSAR